MSRPLIRALAAKRALEGATMAAKQPDPQQTPDTQHDADSGRPETGSGEGRRDVTGIVPDDVHVDPNITERHPGYEESGDSEIIPSMPTDAGKGSSPKK